METCILIYLFKGAKIDFTGTQAQTQDLNSDWVSLRHYSILKDIVGFSLAAVPFSSIFFPQTRCQCWSHFKKKKS